MSDLNQFLFVSLRQIRMKQLAHHVFILGLKYKGSIAIIQDQDLADDGQGCPTETIYTLLMHIDFFLFFFERKQKKTDNHQ